MQAWQNWTTSESSYLVGFANVRHVPRVTLFSDTEYTRKLNQILALELGTKHLHELCRRRHGAAWNPCLSDQHCESAREIRRLIVANRGLPDQDATNLSSEVSVLITRISGRVSRRLGQQTARRMATTTERMLRRRYHNVLQIAPERDKAQLNHLIRQTKVNLSQLLGSSGTLDNRP